MVEQREENPFEDPVVAKEWAQSVEGEKGMIRDNEIYPLLSIWASGLRGVVVEIGSGQGICSQHLGIFAGKYTGVEPSQYLVQRAEELYGSSERLSFLIGTAYTLPIEDASADGVFSVTVWFHLENLAMASRELSRILKPGGIFCIITTNPENYSLWESFYENTEEEGKKVVGKVHIPVNPLTRNTLYRHTLTEMTDALKASGLDVQSITTLGTLAAHPDNHLFISIEGIKR